MSAVRNERGRPKGRRRVLGGLTAGVSLVVALVGCTAAPSSLAVGGRILLIHSDTGVTAGAALQGTLGVDAHGCVTAGSSVLVAPAGSRLHRDGSVTIDGRTTRPSAELSIGGGEGPKPPGAMCDAGSSYWYA